MLSSRKLSVWFACAISAAAQTPTANTAPEAQILPQGRLEQLEATYQDALRKRHQKIIDQYTIDLRAAQALALTAQDKAAYAAEIARIGRIVAQGGIVEPLQASPPPSAPPRKAQLGAGLAYSLDPNETVDPLPAGATLIPLGTASWKLSKLPAGEYDIVADCTCPLVPEGAQVEVELAGQKVTAPVPQSRATKDSQTFRIFRLARLSLPADAIDQVIALRASAPTQPWLQARRIVISRVEKKKAKPDQANP